MTMLVAINIIPSEGLGFSLSSRENFEYFGHGFVSKSVHVFPTEQTNSNLCQDLALQATRDNAVPKQCCFKPLFPFKNFNFLPRNFGPRSLRHGIVYLFCRGVGTAGLGFRVFRSFRT